MKLYMKQKVFSWKDRFTVLGEDGDAAYTVEGKVFSLGKQLTVFNAREEEAAFIRQKVFSFLPRFSVEMGGEERALIEKKFTFLKPKYFVKGPDWEVQGDLWAHNYTVEKNGAAFISIHKKWMTWGDTYEIEIADGINEVFALAVVLAIDAVTAAQEAAQ